MPDKPRASSSSEQDTYAEQVALIFAGQPVSLLMIVLIASILAFVLFPVVPVNWLSGWLLAIVVVSVLRWRLLEVYRDGAGEQGRSPQYWGALFMAGVVASGLTWGAAGFFLFPGDDLPRQAFLCMVLAGLSAGAMSTLAPIQRAANIFFVLSMLPVAIKTLLLGNELATFMGVLVLLFLTVLLISARRLNETILESLRMRRERNRAHRDIQRQAYFDELTELPNRRFLSDRLHRELARARRHQQKGALLCLDIDDFKTINDSLGHDLGNELLVTVASRLRSSSREEDSVARVGGDEFLVLLPDLGETTSIVAREARQVAEKLLNLISEPCALGDQHLQVTASIGIALFPDDGDQESDLLKHADTALYQAKQTGRNNFQFFVKRMEMAADHRLQMERGLRKAMVADELELYLQPLVDRNGELKSAEALLRWNHQDGRVVRPVEFIELAEESGLILDIGEWVVGNGCRIPGLLAGLKNIHRLDYLALNISYKQFQRSDFLSSFERNVETCGVDPARIMMELTESTVIADVDDAIQKMRQLKGRGVRFAIDDFGTGHSTLAYLKKLPVDAIKIDRSFVRHLAADQADAAICESIILLGKRLGLQVVAEGVENKNALDWLVKMGCDTFQGYYFSRPLSLVDFSARYGGEAGAVANRVVELANKQPAG